MSRGTQASVTCCCVNLCLLSIKTPIILIIDAISIISAVYFGHLNARKPNNMNTLTPDGPCFNGGF